MSIARAMNAGDHARAAMLVLDLLGPEILGHLIARLRSEQDAREVFAVFSEDLWRALPTLTVRTSMRAYTYALARHAAHRHLDREVRRARAHLPITNLSEHDALVARVRTVTPVYVRTEPKDAFARLRASLDEDEQALLTFRVDRGLEWLELAEIFGAPEEDLKTVAARLRKRFEALKKKLGRLARDEGLL